MVLEFIGADREVTGSCHYLTFGDTHILIDCGMEQGADLYVNQEIPVNPSLIDYVFVTHAHIDHSGPPRILPCFQIFLPDTPQALDCAL